MASKHSSDRLGAGCGDPAIKSNYFDFALPQTAFCWTGSIFQPCRPLHWARVRHGNGTMAARTRCPTPSSTCPWPSSSATTRSNWHHGGGRSFSPICSCCTKRSACARTTSRPTTRCDHWWPKHSKRCWRTVTCLLFGWVRWRIWGIADAWRLVLHFNLHNWRRPNSSLARLERLLWHAPTCSSGPSSEIWWPLCHALDSDATSRHGQSKFCIDHCSSPRRPTNWLTWQICFTGCRIPLSSPLEGPEVVRKARLIPDQLSRSQILRALGLHPVCQRASNRCLVWVNDELIPFGAPRIYVNDGDYMRIAVPPGSPQVDHIATRCLATAFHQGMTIEEISMRHTLYRLGWHDDLVGPPHVPRQRGFHELADGDEALYLQLYATALPPLEQKPMFLNDEDYFVPCAGAPGARIEEELPHQQEQQPSIVPVADPLQALQMQPAVIQELHMHWLAHMAQFEATNRPVNPTLHIQTWFLAMPAHLHCSEPRSVQLHQHFETWFRSIAEAWLDLLDPHWHVHIHLVRPMPPSTLLERDQRVHVIVVQRPPEDGVANLFSVIATHHVLEPMRHFARFAPLQVGKPQVIGFAGLSQDCYPERSPLQCMVWHGDLELRDQLALRNRNGVSFLIIIQDLPYLQPTQTTTAWDEDDDQLYFLQLSSRTEKRRCLTVGQVAHTQRPSSQPDVVALRLEEAIPCPPKVKVDFTPVQRILDAINSSTNEFVQDWPTGLETPQVTQEAIAELVPLSTEVPIAFHLYTDGSKTPEGAVGAGIVLLIEYQHGFALGGALGKVVLQDGHAGMGENGAVIWALLWALQLSNHTWASYGNIDIHYYFHFDAVNAGYLASGYFRTRKFPNHRILMRSLAHLIHGRHGLSRMHWRHIKAHAGIPWNEFADAIAKFASLHPDQVQDSKLWQTWLQDAEQLRAVQWAWYLEQMQAQSPHVPRFKDGFLECDITQVPVPNIPSQPQSDDHEPEPLKITVDVTIATANVLTLHQSMNHNQGTSISRQSVLMQQFHDAKCIFVGIQETRHRHTSLGYATLGIMYLGIPRHLRDKTECSFGSRTATLYVTKGLALRKNTFELCNPAQICS